jgi:hypothetical protein
VISKILLAALLILVLAFNNPLAAHEGDDHEKPETGAPLILGVLDFPNSGAEAAQDAFTRGVLLLHSFEFDDSRTAFLEAQVIDSGFVMAIWGEASTPCTGCNMPCCSKDCTTRHARPWK